MNADRAGKDAARAFFAEPYACAMRIEDVYELALPTVILPILMTPIAHPRVFVGKIVLVGFVPCPWTSRVCVRHFFFRVCVRHFCRLL